MNEGRKTQMNADEMARKLRAWKGMIPTPGLEPLVTDAADMFENLAAQLDHAGLVLSAYRDDMDDLRAQLTASQRRAQDARNELCQRCGRYREAHNGACNGCRWEA